MTDSEAETSRCEEDAPMYPDERAQEKFMAEMDGLIEVNSQAYAMPERTAAEEEAAGLCVLDDRLSEAIEEVAEGNRRVAEYAKDETGRISMRRHELRPFVEGRVKDIEKIHQDMVAYRNKCAERYVEIRQQERAGEINEFEAQRRREEIRMASRGKITRLGLLSAGLDWPEIGEFSDDASSLVPDGLDPGYRGTRKDIRSRFASMTPEQKREFAKRIEAEAEESGDFSKKKLMDDFIDNWESPY